MQILKTHIRLHIVISTHVVKVQKHAQGGLATTGRRKETALGTRDLAGVCCMFPLNRKKTVSRQIRKTKTSVKSSSLVIFAYYVIFCDFLCVKMMFIHKKCFKSAKPAECICLLYHVDL